MKIRLDAKHGNIWFTSDFHLYHKNVVKFDNRPFLDEFGEVDIEAMHETIITNWNNVVGKNDTVFYLGDLCFATVEKAKAIVAKLNGKIHFIMGNHDKFEDIQKIDRFESINDYVDLTILNVPNIENQHLSNRTPDQAHFCLMHYPIYSWNRKHHGSIMAHGHCHGNLHHGEEADFYINRKVIDVGCNLHDYTPLSFIEIMAKFETNG